MKVQELYTIALGLGEKADPRGKNGLKNNIKERKKSFNRLTAEEKRYYDTETLTIPYPDSRILTGNPDLEITGILAGIDLETPEVILADRLNEKGKNINTLVAHHPEGKALAELHQVMDLQADSWQKAGVSLDIGNILIDQRMKEVQRNLMPYNHNRSVDAAKLLGFAFINVHTAADNLVTKFLRDYLNKNKPKKLKNVLTLLRKIPEYGMAANEGMGPVIISGNHSNDTGKIYVDMTGGTEGPKEAITKLADSGISTIVGMHFGEKLRKKAENAHVNLIVAGHIASDAIGMNLFLDEAERKGLKNITVTSGLVRVRRSGTRR